MQKNLRGSVPQKMNVRDPAAIAAAGFGDPNSQFNPEDELAASQADAAVVAGFNQTHQVPKAPVTTPVVKTRKVKSALQSKTVPVAPPASPEPQEEVEEEEEAEDGVSFSEDPAVRLKQVSDALKELSPTAPSPEQLANWKQMHGDVFVLYMFDKAYVYRYLKRAEWIKMNLDESFQNMRQDQIEEYIFDRCVLWPTFSVIEKAKLPAGTVPSLSEQIRINSMFVDPNRLSQLTVKL